MTTHAVQGFIGGDHEQLAATGRQLSRSARRANEVALELRRAVDATAHYWRGEAGSAFRDNGDSRVQTLLSIADRLAEGAHAHNTLALELEEIQSRAARAASELADLGMDASTMAQDPVGTIGQLVQNPTLVGPVAARWRDVLQARWQANRARDRFMDTLASVGQHNFRGGDLEYAYELRHLRMPPHVWMGAWLLASSAHPAIDRTGLPAAVASSPAVEELMKTMGNEYETRSDWAGRAILAHWLYGGVDVDIVDNRLWADYMMSNERLSDFLEAGTRYEAERALARFRAGEGREGGFDLHFPPYHERNLNPDDAITMENGEGIVGYEYLHGPDQHVGGFRHSGNTTVTRLGDRGYEVTVDATYVWNDIIDPNPGYSTDQDKSRTGEDLTNGVADDYRFRVTWHDQATAVFDSTGELRDLTFQHRPPWSALDTVSSAPPRPAQ